MRDAPNYLLLLPGRFPGCDPTEFDRCRTLADARRSVKCGYLIDGEPVVPIIYKKVEP